MYLHFRGFIVLLYSHPRMPLLNKLRREEFMKPKDGSPVTIIEPMMPEEAFAADDAKPGEVSKAKAKQLEAKKGKYGSTKSPAFKPVVEEDQDEKNSAWIEIELVDEDNHPVAGEKYKVTLPNGSASTGTLDGKGYARISGFEPGSCKVTFPHLDKDAWKQK
jgi:hypothetical protein